MNRNITEKKEEKQLYRRFKRRRSDIVHKKTWIWLNFQRETKSLLTAALNAIIKTNLMKPRIDKTQQNSRCRLCGDRDEMINHIISECSKLAQKEPKIRHDWVGKVINWELRKKLKFYLTTNGIYKNPACVLRNETQKLIWDFDI